jgi:hypothetical protein
MSDQDPSLEPGQEQRLRALLAGLGSEAGDEADPLPPEVAMRLDETLAGLVAEREAAKMSEEHRATGRVVPLRPRWMPRLAAAAAAVIVLGLGAMTWASLGHPRGNETATSSGAGAGSAQKEQAPTASARSAAPDLHAATFARDVRTYLLHTPTLRVPAPLKQQSQGEDSSSSSGSTPTSPTAACVGPRITDGSNLTVVTLDAAPAVLVVHPVKHGERLVEAWSCGGHRRLASTTVAP